ncbi:MAG TPA: lysylphosphatidylglycerol synthase domain-containing protein [Mycobacteriales bacterium]|nr:lysylphosphatidylglycerol synthase domain-containing protein [Mycobacteriales bacterium]
MDRGGRSRWWRLARRAFAVALVVALGLALAERWSAVRPDLARISPPAVAAALAALGAALWCSLRAWRVVLADLGSPLPTAVAARIFFVGQIGKYLPGSLWPVVAQMEMGRDEGVPRTRMAVSFLVNLGLAVLVGLALGLPVLLARGGGPLALFALVSVAVALPLLAQPRLLNAGLTRALALARRPPLDHDLSRRVLARAVGWLLACWIAYGLHVWALAVDLGARPLAALPVAVAAYAVAFSVGILVVIAPAGAGVREVLLVVALAPVLSTDAATAVAVVSRLLLTVMDTAAAGLSVVGRRRHRARTDAAGQVTTGCQVDT